MAWLCAALLGSTLGFARQSIALSTPRSVLRCPRLSLTRRPDTSPPPPSPPPPPLPPPLLPPSPRCNTQALLPHSRCRPLPLCCLSFCLEPASSAIHTPVRCLCSTLCECERPRHPGNQAPIHRHPIAPTHRPSTACAGLASLPPHSIRVYLHVLKRFCPAFPATPVPLAEIHHPNTPCIHDTLDSDRQALTFISTHTSAGHHLFGRFI
jgi:hypothetical protein